MPSHSNNQGCFNFARATIYDLTDESCREKEQQFIEQAKKLIGHSMLSTEAGQAMQRSAETDAQRRLQLVKDATGKTDYSK